VIRQFELVDRVRAYDKNVDEALLNKAYVFAMQAHGTQKRASGDPYFSHPLEVAGILTSMRLDSDTIATALLHDVVEDTVATIPEIDDAFGSKIAELVDGVTKLSKIELQTESVRQAENFRKFLIAMSNDIRVLLVKLADRLHNMRTLHHIKKPEKRRRISLETLEIYAPLAERLGMNELKDELQHLALQYFDPEGMESITKRLSYLIEQSPYLEKETVETLRDVMRDNGIEAEVSSRIKSPYSIWKKMGSQKVDFEQLSDVMAFRILVPEMTDCYQALGVVHQAYSVVPGRFKDYISMPKRNLYRSIHTTVMGPNSKPLEIQIRTHAMHSEAEYGVAAHWQYKQDTEGTEGKQFRWIQELLTILEHSGDAEEFLEHSKLAMFQDQVFCYTPKGDLISLPRGGTCVDFAYAVHTEVGDHCIGAKINGRMVPLRHVLKNGDQVEILTSKEQVPSVRWESFVVSGKARSAIRRHIRLQEYAEFGQAGKNLIEQSALKNGLQFTHGAAERAANTLGLEDVDQLFVDLGQGKLSEENILRAAFPGFKEISDEDRLPEVHTEWELAEDTAVMVLNERLRLPVHLAACCSPVKGDRIFGLKVPEKGLEVHRMRCAVSTGVDENTPNWVDVAWRSDGKNDAFYVANLKLEVINERGALASIASTAAKNGGNLSNLEIPERDPEFCLMKIDVEVKDKEHLIDIIRAFRLSRVVSRVERAMELVSH